MFSNIKKLVFYVNQVWLDVKHQIKEKIIIFRLIDYEIVVSWSPVPTSLSLLSSCIAYQHK